MPKIIHSAFDGFEIKVARMRQRTPAWALAQAIGICPTLLSHYETGRRAIPEHIATAIAKHLNTPIQDLMKKEATAS